MLLTIELAMQAARVSRETLHRWRKKGKVKATKTGSGRWRFDEDSLKAFLGEPETDKKADTKQKIAEALAWFEEVNAKARGRK